jgi:hypothetical protein
MEITVSLPNFTALWPLDFWEQIPKCLRKSCSSGTNCLRKNGLTSALIEKESSFCNHFEANKMYFPMTCYTEKFSAVMFSRSSDSNFDFVFLKMWYFNFLKNILFAYNCYLKYPQISSWDWSRFGFCEEFWYGEPLQLNWWGNFKQLFSSNFFTFIN